MFTLEWSKKWGGDEREERLPRIADFPSTRIANDEIRPRNFNTVQDLTSTTPRQSSTVARLKKVFCGHNITLLILSKFFKLCWKRTTRAAAIVWSHITSSARFFCLKEKVFTICSVLLANFLKPILGACQKMIYRKLMIIASHEEEKEVITSQSQICRSVFAQARIRARCVYIEII